MIFCPCNFLEFSAAFRASLLFQNPRQRLVAIGAQPHRRIIKNLPTAAVARIPVPRAVFLIAANPFFKQFTHIFPVLLARFSYFLNSLRTFPTAAQSPILSPTLTSRVHALRSSFISRQITRARSFLSQFFLSQQLYPSSFLRCSLISVKSHVHVLSFLNFFFRSSSTPLLFSAAISFHPTAIFLTN